VGLSSLTIRRHANTFSPQKTCFWAAFVIVGHNDSLLIALFWIPNPKVPNPKVTVCG
jgi:hypothetical protein